MKPATLQFKEDGIYLDDYRLPNVKSLKLNQDFTDLYNSDAELDIKLTVKMLRD